jgi:hypothetical protein
VFVFFFFFFFCGRLFQVLKLKKWVVCWGDHSLDFEFNILLTIDFESYKRDVIC